MASTIPLDRLRPLINAWVATGAISDEDRELLKADYARDFGLPGSCTPCYWNNVQIHYRLLIREQTVNKANPEYIIDPKKGTSFRPTGQRQSVVNEGVEGPNTVPLTKELAEQLLADNPDYGDIIIRNPKYVAPSQEPNKQEAPAKKKKAPSKKGKSKTDGQTPPKPDELPSDEDAPDSDVDQVDENQTDDNSSDDNVDEVDSDDDQEENTDNEQ